MIQVEDKKDCCGCTACESICSHSAISMQCDEVGFTFPYVDAEKCVECGLCTKVCPIVNENPLSDTHSRFVAVTNDNSEQLSSTSGGLASVFARYVIDDMHGVVYGCNGEDYQHIRHIRIDTVEDINRLKGSKYVQSDVSGVYRNVKEDLRQKKIVLFVGTPCQNAGLKKYLRKEYDNLYCVDFVCHGVPSQKMLTDHICGLKLSQAPAKVGFRYKEKGKESKYLLTIVNKYNSLLYRKPYGVDYYMSGFIEGLFYRDSCYACKFAKPQRIGDITIGDYWDKAKEYSCLKNSKDGLSQMHINTEKGKRLLENLSGKLHYKPIELDKLLKHSLQLHEPMHRHENNSLFMQQYPKIGFAASCKAAMAYNYKAFKKQRIVDMIFFIPGSYQLYQKIKKIL